MVNSFLCYAVYFFIFYIHISTILGFELPSNLKQYLEKANNADIFKLISNGSMVIY